MNLTVHRPARLLSSLQGDDPAALEVSVLGLPLGTTLDPEVLRGAACGENDPWTPGAVAVMDVAVRRGVRSGHRRPNVRPHHGSVATAEAVAIRPDSDGGHELEGASDHVVPA